MYSQASFLTSGIGTRGRRCTDTDRHVATRTGLLVVAPRRNRSKLAVETLVGRKSLRGSLKWKVNNEG